MGILNSPEAQDFYYGEIADLGRQLIEIFNESTEDTAPNIFSNEIIPKYLQITNPLGIENLLYEARSRDIKPADKPSALFIAIQETHRLLVERESQLYKHIAFGTRLNKEHLSRSVAVISTTGFAYGEDPYIKFVNIEALNRRALA